VRADVVKRKDAKPAKELPSAIDETFDAGLHQLHISVQEKPQAAGAELDVAGGRVLRDLGVFAVQ